LRGWTFPVSTPTTAPMGMAAPAYDPRMMVALLFYAYAKGNLPHVVSSASAESREGAAPQSPRRRRESDARRGPGTRSPPSSGRGRGLAGDLHEPRSRPLDDCGVPGAPRGGAGASVHVVSLPLPEGGVGWGRCCHGRRYEDRRERLAHRQSQLRADRARDLWPRRRGRIAARTSFMARRAVMSCPSGCRRAGAARRLARGRGRARARAGGGARRGGVDQGARACGYRARRGAVCYPRPWAAGLGARGAPGARRAARAGGPAGGA